MLRNVHLGIDIGNRELRAVALRPRREGRWEILSTHRFAYPADQTLLEALDSFSKWFEELLEPYPRRPQVVCGLPSVHTVIKVVDFPPASPADIEKMVPFEAQTHIPIPPEQALFGHALIGRRTEEGQRVLLAGCRRELVDDLIAEAGKTGVRIARIDISALAAMRVLAAAGNVRGVKSGSGLMGVHCDHDAFTVVLGDRAGVRVLRVIGVSASGIEDESSARHLASQLRLLLQAYRAAIRGHQIGSLLFTGPAIPDAPYREMISEFVGLPVVVATPWNRCDTARVPDADANVFAAATGLAVRAGPFRFGVDLRPPTEEQALRESRAWQRFAAAALAGVLLLGGVTFSLNSRVSRQFDRVLDLEMEVVRTRTRVEFGTKKVAAEEAPVDVLARRVLDVRRDGLMWLDLMRRLSLELPAEVWVSDLTLEREKAVTLRGVATTQAAVARSVGVLRNMPLFEDVSLGYVNTVEVEGKQVYQFQVICQLPKDHPKGRTRRR